MNYNNQAKNPAFLNPKVLLILGVILTLAIIMGIRFLIVEDTSESLPGVPGQNAIFREEKPGNPPPGSLPAARSEASSGDSLAIFEKANVGYSTDRSSAAAGAGQAGPEAAKVPAPAVKKKAAAAASKKVPRGTVIPRMQGAKPFGTAVPDKKGMPDMSGMMKQAGQDQGSGD